MPTPQYAPGYPNKVSFQPSGGSLTDINVTGWDYSLKAEWVETTGTGSGGVQEGIFGLGRGSFSFALVYDLANYYHSVTPGVLAGVKGYVREYVSATKFWQFPIAITEETGKSVVSGKVEVTVSAVLDSSAGVISRPA